MHKILRIIKNTHRHPVNQALHSLGAPFYGLGILMSIGNLVGIQTNLGVAGTMLLAAVTMFVLGHKIEGNIRSMMPVLFFKFLYAIVSGRKVARYSVAKRVHVLWT